MKVAIWDTYITRADGSVIHIDIVVPEQTQDEGTIYNYGQTYLKNIGETGSIDADYCQYCHIEDPNEQMVNDISDQGFSIIRMEDIPKELPENPNRRAMILHLRAHSNEYRFASFKDKTEADLIEMIRNV